MGRRAEDAGVYCGHVKDAARCSPLDDVRVVARGRDGGILGRTSTEASAGRWELEVDDAVSDLQFSCPGFVPKTIDASAVRTPVRLLRNELVAYQDSVGCRPGESVVVFVHSPGQYRASLQRHGLRREQVLDLGTRSAGQQQVPDGHFVADGLGWEPTFRYEVPVDAGGLYSLLLEAEEGDRRIALPLVVSGAGEREISGASDRLLVLASTNNWHMYNCWGGRSRYRNFEGNERSPEFLSVRNRALRALRSWAARLAPESIKDWAKARLGIGSPDWHHAPLSTHRPLLNGHLEEPGPHERFTNHLAAGEWRVLAWLEREGFEYDVVTGRQLHHNPEVLNDYPALVLSTHCEYWSCRMLKAVRDAHVRNGLWLLNLGGNAMYRESEFPSPDSVRCSSLRLSKSCADELELIGVRFTLDDYGTCAPYRAIRPDHWAFRGAPLDGERIFGEDSLNRPTAGSVAPGYEGGRPGLEGGLQGTGASGWETDKTWPSTPDTFTVLAQGRNPDGGAEMVIREPSGSSGGAFSASSITYGGALLVDDVISTLTGNVVRRALGAASS